MKQEDVADRTAFQPSFAKALDDNYLGSPAVVGKLVGEFVWEICGWVGDRSAGKMPPGGLTEKANERGFEFARIFSGESPDYKPVVGWNSRVGGLNAYLKTDLGDFWKQEYEKYDKDPFRVFYAWLVCMTFDALKQGSDDLIDAAMGNLIGKATKHLTGTVKRR